MRLTLKIKKDAHRSDHFPLLVSVGPQGGGIDERVDVLEFGTGYVLHEVLGPVLGLESPAEPFLVGDVHPQNLGTTLPVGVRDNGSVYVGNNQIPVEGIGIADILQPGASQFDRFLQGLRRRGRFGPGLSLAPFLLVIGQGDALPKGFLQSPPPDVAGTLKEVALDHVDLDHGRRLGDRLGRSLLCPVELIEKDLGDGDEAVGKEFHFFHQVVDLLLLLRIVAHLQSFALALVADRENLLQVADDHIVGRPVLIGDDGVVDVELDVLWLAHDKRSWFSCRLRILEGSKIMVKDSSRRTTCL